MTKSAKVPSPKDLRDLRIARNLSQEDLAKLAGVSQSQVARMETGTVNPTLRTVNKVLQALNKVEDGIPR